jgi:monoterpene epsilon-lactone hydrolase
VITVDYRQAPFHEYPSASEDVEAIYRQLLKQYRPEAIGIFGCSSGGALAAQVVAWFQSKGLPRPGAVGILCSSPPIAEGLPDRGGDSRIWASGPIPKSQLSGANKEAFEPYYWYMRTAEADDPRAYPGSSDEVLAKFPPALFLVGTREAAASLAIASHARLLKLGVDSSLYVMEGATHAAHIMAVGTPEARDANAYIAHWFNQHLAR